jgi:hypothetical protein
LTLARQPTPLNPEPCSAISVHTREVKAWVLETVNKLDRKSFHFKPEQTVESAHRVSRK